MKTETEIVNALREISKAKRVKLTDLAIKVDVPYRSLQNWFAIKSSMPLPIYVAICTELGLSGAFSQILAFSIGDDEEDRAIVDIVENVHRFSAAVPLKSRDWLRILQGDILRLVQVICDLRIRLRALEGGN